MSIFVTSVNPKIVNTKESIRKCEDSNQEENSNLKIPAIIVRVTKENICTQREFEITHDVSNSNNIMRMLCQKTKQEYYFKQPNLLALFLMLQGL